MSQQSPASPRNMTPPWSADMPSVMGMAAHPNLQRRTDAELLERLARLRSNLSGDELLFGSSRDPEAVALLADDREMVDATKLALHWRGIEAPA